jgi:hypothetical protein
VKGSEFKTQTAKKEKEKEERLPSDKQEIPESLMARSCAEQEPNTVQLLRKRTYKGVLIRCLPETVQLRRSLLSICSQNCHQLTTDKVRKVSKIIFLT